MVENIFLNRQWQSLTFDELQELVPKFYFIKSRTLCNCSSLRTIDSMRPGVK